MRQLFTSAILLACSAFIAQAGEENNALTTAGKQMGNIFPHFNPELAVNKSSGQSSRLIGKVYTIYNSGIFVPVDSTTYTYYGNSRGTGPNINEPNSDDHILFDNSYTYLYNAGKSAYDNSLYRTQAFDGTNKVTELIYKEWKVAYNEFKNKERYIYNYDNAGKMTSSLRQNWYGTLWQNSINSVLNYDAQNNVVQMNSVEYHVDFAYDNNNNLLSMTDKHWIGTGWSNNSRKTYTYSGQDVAVYVLELWNISSARWESSKRWEYSYNTNHDKILAVEYSWSGSAWVNDRAHIYNYDSYRNMTDEVLQVWDGSTYMNKEKIVWTYNVNKQPETITEYTWQNNGWIHNDGNTELRFYYETYDPTSVKDFAAHAASMTLYPVPASNNLQVDVSFDKPQPFNLIITDLSGRIVLSQSQSAIATFHQSLNTANMANGQYFYSVRSDDVNITRPFTIAH